MSQCAWTAFNRFIYTDGVKILLQYHFFKARDFQPLLSPFIGKLACQGFKSVLWLRYPKTLGPGRGNGHKEREAGWCSVKTYWFSVSTVTPVLGGTGMKDKKKASPSILASTLFPSRFLRRSWWDSRQLCRAVRDFTSCIHKCQVAVMWLCLTAVCSVTLPNSEFRHLKLLLYPSAHQCK